MRFKAIIYILAVVAILLGIALILASKLPAGPLVTPAASASYTESPTGTARATLTRTSTPTRTATITPVPSQTPTSTPTSPFASIADLVSIPAGDVYELWVSASGELWVAAGNGLFRHISEGTYQRVSNLVFSRILGTDDSGRLWAIDLNGAAILAYDGAGWKAYGMQQGWAPVQPGTVQDGLAVDAGGQLWLGTGADDLRRFDPGTDRWESLDSAALGFTPADPAYQGHFLTSAAIAPDGAVWAADCIGMGEGFSGQGVRALEAGTWQALQETAAECVYAVERDPQGRMWLGGFDKLLRYDPGAGSWAEIPLPAWDRRQIVTSLRLDPAGNPWVGILRCGGAACDTLVFYFLKGGTWTPFLDESTDYQVAPGLGFSPDGSAWICSQGRVYRRSAPGRLEQVGSLDAAACRIAVDGTGAVWVGASSGPAAGLWQVKP